MQYGTRLFNDGWQFALYPAPETPNTPDQITMDVFAPVALPHDWLIAHGDALYQDGEGWYRRVLAVDDAAGQHISLRFEGVYMDTTVYLNRRAVGEWKYGYSTFDVDLTPQLQPGENEILVRVEFRAPNSRWYSGAGIYRDVWLNVAHSDARLVADGTYATTTRQPDGSWRLHITTELAGENVAQTEVAYALLPCDGADAVAPLFTQIVTPEGTRAALDATLTDPLVWDVDAPNRYCLQTTLLENGELLQQSNCTVGFRTIEFSPEQGFLLNGRKIKLNGVCEHHDLGCLGTAYNSAAMRRKLVMLREMGVNALRLTHNMFAPDVMELADEMGFLVVSEAFDMWESSKTTYDYARFFPAWYKKDVASWVRRDRNHPSLIMWSIGNEIYDTHASVRGQELTVMLRDEVRLHDPAGNAGITIGSNYMPWENAQKCADIVKLAGYNYGEKYYDEHHAAHPDWVIYGSETASVVSSRGIYHFPFAKQLLADEDEQCSSLGNSTTSWGARSAEACVLAERDHPYSCGQFLWTGFDYIGEPTPYHTRSCYFGQIDTAGFAKDGYYIYQAAWTDAKQAPMVHLFPYWDFNEGQLIDVRACTNAARVQLYLNGELQGEHKIDHAHGTDLVGHWQLPYTPGELVAVAYDEEGNEVARDSRRSFGEAAALRLHTESVALHGDACDLAFFEISAVDAEGNPVENAVNRIRITVEGAGYLAGLDNGDSTDTDEYKTDSRRLFSGKLLAVVVADAAAGNVTLRAESIGLTSAELTLPVLPATVAEGTGIGAWRADCNATVDSLDNNEHPVRALRLTADGSTILTPEHNSVTVTARVCPEEAEDKEVRWCAVDDGGVPTELVALQADGRRCTATAVGDGKFRLRCLSKAGTGAVRIISELELTAEGLGHRWHDPYTFVPGALYDYSRGDVGNGNEHGVATARTGESQVGFHGIDFGPDGSDEITLPIFALDDKEYPIQIWEGMPDEPDSALVAEVVYQMPSQWNVYQPATYRLNKALKGVTSLCFVLHQKVHIKGFSFKKPEHAFAKLSATACTHVYGDSFVRHENENSIDQIGNNVTILFDGMDFGEQGASGLTVCGATPLDHNTIQLRLSGEEGDSVELLEFNHADTPTEQYFTLNRLRGMHTVSFVFLPGCNFDFKWFRFEK